MDPAYSKPPVKVWLLLGLVILMLHLLVLTAFPLQMSAIASPSAPMNFSIRTLADESLKPLEPTNPLPVPNSKAAKPAKVTPPLPIAQPQPSAAEHKPAVPEDDPLPTEAPLADNPSLMALAPQPELYPKSSLESKSTRPDVAPAMLALRVNAVPASIKLIYEVQSNKFPYNLNGELVWISANGSYQANLVFGAFGLKRSQSSRGQIGQDGLMPERFSDKFRSEVAAHFNRQLGKITFSANTPDAPLQAGAQDRLSVLIQLAALVSSSPERFTPATNLTIQTVGPRDADQWLFTVGEAETLALPGGKLALIKLTRNPRQAYDQQMDIWLAPTLGYLPARIRITEASGDFVDLKWLRSESAQPS